MMLCDGFGFVSKAFEMNTLSVVDVVVVATRREAQEKTMSVRMRVESYIGQHK